MKKLLLLVFSMLMLCSCSEEGTPATKTTTSSSSEEVTTSLSTTMTEVVTSTTTLSDEEYALKTLDEMMQALINKDEKAWVSYTGSYVEGENGYLYAVDFDSYKIIDYSLGYYFGNEEYKLNNFKVELIITDSDDSRFPAGKSLWNIAILNQSSLCFLPDSLTTDDIFFDYYENGVSINQPAEFAYIFSYSFNAFQTIDDIENLPDAIGRDAFMTGLDTFLSGISPESDIYGEYYYSVKTINEILSNYLGIENYSWDSNFNGYSGDLWKRWDMRTQYSVINAQTDEYIDMTFYADYIYLTPAKRMKFYFTTDDDGSLQLTKTELIDDYGVEPNWYYY